MTRRKLAKLGTALALVAAMSAALPAAPADAATPQCTKRLDHPQQKTPRHWVPAASNNSRSCLAKQGLDNNGVWALQRALVVCYGKNIAIDGIYGPKTLAALDSVQKQVGTAADGVYGPKTAGLMKFSSTSSTSSKACKAQGPVKAGSGG